MVLDLSKTRTPEKKTEPELYEPQRENHFTGALENTFLCKTDIYLKLQYNLFEKAVFFNM